MSLTLFVSDVHLHPERPAIQDIFSRFLLDTAPSADALYILGDLFEYWLGDDDVDSPYSGTLELLHKASRSTLTYFIAGNRDFLVGERFQKESGCRLLPEYETIDLYGRNTLITHGDTLCIDDRDYQRFREMVRRSEWNDKVMQMPLVQRKAYFHSLRQESQDFNAVKPAEIMDVSQQEVERVMSEAHVDLLIHGHTHRPAIHHFQANGIEKTRIVLGDWYKHGNVLYYFDNGNYKLIEL